MLSLKATVTPPKRSVQMNHIKQKKKAPQAAQRETKKFYILSIHMPVN
jgi:hypothetical protein